MAAEQSFAKQIRKLIVVTCAIAVVLTTIACWAVLQYLMRSTAHERADTLANLLASNAPAVLALKDQPRASELLRSAAASHQLVAARLTDNLGVVLASFNRGRNSGESDLSFGTSSVSKPVIYAGETLGTVDVQVDSSIVATVPTFFVLACVGIISLLLLAVWLLAKPVERWITRPIGALSMFTRRIRDTQNYALRVPQSKAKELHGFVDDFNAMLGEIEKTSQAQSKQSSQLSKLAYFDPLTGAANRTLFRDRLTACVDTHRREHIPFAIIGIDLDYFKQLNDSLGHNVGDDYLRAASNRCLAQLGPECTFARMGGDEFLVLLPGVGTVREARLIAENLGQALREANAIHNSNVQCSGSIGIGLFPFDAANPSELMSKVDAAMYRAKANGRNCVETVSVDDEQEIAARPQPATKSFLSSLQDAS